jgi:hypothetical protein
MDHLHYRLNFDLDKSRQKFQQFLRQLFAEAKIVEFRGLNFQPNYVSTKHE